MQIGPTFADPRAAERQIQQARSTAEFKAVKDKLKNRDWRLDNLYWIKTKEGPGIPFKRNAAQLLYSGEQWSRDVILKGRQIGFSTYIELEILDDCLFLKNTTAGIVDRTQDDAEDKLAKIKFAYERLPAMLRQEIRLDAANNSELKFSNGSSVTAGTSYRGGTLQFLHVSEYGKISAKSPDVAREIKTGSMGSVPKNGKIRVESTADGLSGEFYDLVKVSQAAQLEGQRLTSMDFKFHFFGWWMLQENRLPSNLVIVPPQMHAYFDELEVKYGIKTDAAQRAWYATEHKRIGPDDMLRENPSVPEEAFYASNEGAYFREQMTNARKDKRIGQPVPFDSNRPVNTFWDIGMDDQTVIIFHQSDGVRHRFIDYWEGSGEGLGGAIRVLKEKQGERRFIYGQHIGPHDLAVRDWSQMVTKSRKEVAAEFGVNFTVVPRVQEKAESIEAARRMLETSCICSVYCGKLVEHLDNYSKKWNKTTGAYTSQPAENGAQHAADALQQGAVFLRPDKDKSPARFRPRAPQGTTQWSG